MSFTESEQRLVKYAREKIKEYSQKRRKKGLYDKIFAFALSESGHIYDGMCVELNVPQFNLCAEKLAIGNMVLREGEKTELKSLLVAEPVPDSSEEITGAPCGSCRHLIFEYGGADTTVLCSEFIRKDEGWKFFPKIKKYKITELYPHPYEPTTWD